MPHRDDDRIALLQRLAYGAGTSDVERASAAAELALLRDGATASAPAMFHRPSALGAPANPAATTATAAGGDDPFALLLRPGPEAHRPRVGDGPAAEPAPRLPAPATDAAAGATPSPAVGSLVRWIVTTAAVSLAVGVIAGWSFGARVVPVGPEAGGPSMIPVSDIPALVVFDRPQVPEDVPASVAGDPTYDPTTFRLLASRVDGVTVHAARAAGGDDVCVIVAVPDTVTASACTSDRRFPGDGLSIEARGTGRTAYAATWHPSGEVTVNLPGAAG